MPLAEQLLPALDRRRKRRPSVPTASPDAVLNSPSLQPQSSNVGHVQAPLVATTGATGVPVSRSVGGAPSYSTAPPALPALVSMNSPARAQAVLPGPRKPEEPEAPTLYDKLNRGFAPGETITPRQTAILAEAYGLPGRTYSRAIVPGESGYQPGIRNPDDATPSLFQITPSVQSADTQAKFDAIASRHPGGYSNPIAAAKQAAFLARGSADEGVGNYVAYNPSAPQGHLRGGRERARELLGQPSRSRRPLSTNELFYDPGTNLVDGQLTDPIGGHDTHVHYGSDDPRSILRAARIAEKMGLRVGENPAYDPVEPVHTEGSMHYSTVPITDKQAKRFDIEGNEVGTAIDVTGEGLAQYNAKLARLSGASVVGGAPTSSGGVYGSPSAGNGGYVRTPGARDPVPLLGTGDPAATGEVQPIAPLPFGAASPSAAAPVAGEGRRSPRQTPEETMALLRLLAEEEERYG